ncbi:MAG TPA: radical SAM protein [Desulfatiglandales bacterium]|nr:radical SAM protein [Desulfatiglandales bacterium]
MNDLTEFMKAFGECRLCPRNCGINRVKGSKKARSGFCGQDNVLRVAYVGAHFGEEPPISGTRGSGTVFFSGCSLKCSFCQNYQISRDGLGKAITLDELSDKVSRLIMEKYVHNINLVTPDHFFPYTFRLVETLRERGHEIPVVYNMSGYQSISSLHMAEAYADIYLPDYKYSDPSLSWHLSRCKDYPGFALEAISEMIRQKGFLDSFKDKTALATKGVLVRHLILPGKIENSLNALTSLFVEFGADLPISLMSQYHPVLPHEDMDMNRPIKREEFDMVYAHALDLGLRNIFVQIPHETDIEDKMCAPFVPDFREEEPFADRGDC